MSSEFIPEMRRDSEMLMVEVSSVGLRQSRMKVSTTDRVSGTAREEAPSPVS